MIETTAHEALFGTAFILPGESLKRIVQSCQGRDAKESLIRNVKKCKYLLNSNLEKSEVMKLGRELSSGVSWQDLHVCLVFLQDLPKVNLKLLPFRLAIR